MEETGLDPTAEEFHPRNPNTHFFPPPPIYYHYPLLPPPPSPPYPFNDLHILPCSIDSSVGFGNFPTPTPNPPLSPPSSAATRSLSLRLVPSYVSESTIRRELELFGEVRGVQMERVLEGIVTVHFYNLDHARTALKEMREQHVEQQNRPRHLSYYGTSPATDLQARGLIAGCAVWPQFVIPASNAVTEGQNQGTIVVFNLDSEVSNSRLREIFEPFGPVKELRGTPLKKNQKFIEFFDIRDAAKALREMNGKNINGKNVVIEYSRPGGYGRKLFSACSSTHSSTESFSSTRITIHTAPHPLRSCGKRNPNRNANKNPIDDSMASMSLSCGIEETDAGECSRRNTDKTVGKQPKGKPWKGRNARQLDSRFLINQDAVDESNCLDSRTTVMIKNIPNKYSQKLLLNMLDNHCIHCNEQIADEPLSSYDFVYLPIDFNNKCNVGYGFVNMTTPESALRLYKAFHLQPWEVFNSRKICQVNYARVQGLEALKEHFKNSKFPYEMNHYLPVAFSPPRDGRQLTQPQPVVGNNEWQQSITTGLSGLSADEMDFNDTDGGSSTRNGGDGSLYGEDDS